MSLKRKRLPGGRWVTYVEKESTAADLEKARPEEIWTTGDGRKILPKDMDLRHIANVMKLLEGRQKATQVAAGLTPEEIAKVTGTTYPIYIALAKELARRIRGESPAPTENRVKRKFNWT